MQVMTGYMTSCKHCGTSPSESEFVPKAKWMDGSIKEYRNCCRPCWDEQTRKNREAIRLRHLEQKVLNQPSTEDNAEEAQIRERLWRKSQDIHAREYLNDLDRESHKLDKLGPEARRLQEKKIGFRRLHRDVIK